MANRRSTRNATAATSKKAKTAPKVNKPAATKKAVKKESEPSPELTDPDDGDSDDEEYSMLYDLETQNERMVRKVQCIMINGNVAILDEKNDYTQTIVLTSKKPFSLEPALMKSGRYPGRYALVLQPEPTDNEMFPFLELPAEIRNIIYSYVLERPGWTVSLSGKHSGTINNQWRTETGQWVPRATPPYNTGLMRVNKQIAAESTPYLFNLHKFEFPDSTLLLRFLEYIGSERVKSLVSVKVDRQYSSTARNAYKLLASATSLTNLEVSNYHWRNYSNKLFVPDWPLLLLPLMQALCLEGKSREDALGVVSVTDGVKGRCSVHHDFTPGSMKLCRESEQAFKVFYEKLREDTYKAMDEADTRANAITKGAPVKTRSGRKTKAVYYADDDSDSNCEG